RDSWWGSMKRTALTSLRCPYTGSAFGPIASADSRPAVDFGVVSSEAGAFPIIAGVLRLLTDDLQGPLVKLGETGRHEMALKAALEVPFLSAVQRKLDGTWRRLTQRWNPGFAALTGPKKTHLHRVVTAADVSYAKLARSARAEGWASWQTYRFS